MNLRQLRDNRDNRDNAQRVTESRFTNVNKTEKEPHCNLTSELLLFVFSSPLFDHLHTLF